MPNTTANDGDLHSALRARGQRVTTQRIVLHRALRELGRHVSAEQLLQAVEDRLPGLALPTVYATLDVFEQIGLARRVPVPGGPVLYEPFGEPHHHLACRSCGEVEDVAAGIDLEPALREARERGWRPAGGTVVVSGICAACARDERAGAAERR